MKNFTKLLLLTGMLLVTVTFRSNAQSVLNPADSVITYNPSSPPVEPPFGTIGKWVRTVRMGWNTSAYKAYIYKGVAFRLKYPKSYNPAVNDGKKYPMLIFFHGLGEASPTTDNEFHLLWGAEYFAQSVENGTYDGYILMMQSQGHWGAGHYTFAKELADYMIVNNKLDPFRSVANGLSSGGQGTWEMFLNHTNFIVGTIPMSSVAYYYREKATVDKCKFTPFWNAHGGLDGSPSPYTAYEVRDSMLGAGANYRNIMYPTKGHDTWNETFAEADYWPFISQAYASNPWPLYGKTDFTASQTLNATIGLAPGYDAYEWRKDGAIITTATSNSITVTQAGLYDARVRRGTYWSDWSRKPVSIRIVPDSPPVITTHIEAEDYIAMSGIKTENAIDGTGGLNVGWQDNGDWMDYSVNVPYSGNFTLKFRVATESNGAQFQLRGQDGSIFSAVTVPNTGGWQKWQTISVSSYLPAGQQTLRIFTLNAAGGGWNINWWEITNGTTPPPNQPPTANAGSPQTITLPVATVTLNGSGSDADGTISSYAWSQVSGPAGASFSSAATASTNVTGLVQGSYVFRLTVTDNNNATATADVTITVQPATAPGTSFKIEAENWSAMNGVRTENTSDVGGGLNVGWQENGDWMDYSVNLSTAGSYTVSFRVATANTGVQFQLKKADGSVLTTVTVPNTGWWQTFQTVSAVVSLPAGQQTLRIYTLDAKGSGWNINWWEITAGSTPPPNQPPTANAGSPQTITLPVATVTLTGSGSDADGTIASYAWSQVSGPAGASFSSPATASTDVTGLVQGSYVFRLTVRDNSNATGTSDVTITVQPATQPGTSFKIEAENWSAMNGVRTENTADAGGGINVGWQENGDWMDYSVNLATAGSYTVRFRVATTNTGVQFQLKKSDGSVLTTVTVPNTGGWQTFQTVSAVVTLPAGQQTLRIYTLDAKGSGWNINWWEIIAGGTPPPNQPPTANAGSPQTITLPVSTVTLSGSGSDADGSITSYAWSQVSGPASASFSSPTAATTNVTGLLVQGSYVFRLTVTDNSNATATSDVTITVLPAPAPGTSFKIEAENWSAMSGVRTENTSDVGGGINVGWQENGDWMDYSLNLSTAGTYTVSFRVATTNTGVQFQLRRADASVLTTVTVPNTGWWQTFQTVSAVVSLPAGQQTLRIYTLDAKGSGWNINWWEVVRQGTGTTVDPSITSAPVSETIIENSSESKMQIFPNPVRSAFTLAINNELTGRMNIELVNAAGARMRTYRIEKPTTGVFRTTLQIGNLQQGNYFLRVSMDGWTEGKKLMKQ